MLQAQSLSNVSPLVLILTSAAIGALVSSLVGFIGQLFDRRARRQEILLAKSIDLAVVRTALLKELAEATGNPVTFYDHIVLAERYYKWLEHLADKGSLPSDARLHRLTDRHPDGDAG